ncbi:MAG: ABC transporter ATP-binding protein [Deltaproteobacteria bacterium]|nr:ABC transporter ATP-binding protein [Deltaproteobacteria bacterium]
MNAIEAHNLTKNYRVYLKPFDRLKEAVLRKPCHDLVEALSDVSFEVPEGDTLGIIGENGAGKSTLLKILAGTTRPTSGEMVKRGRMAALLELGSGFHPEFSGRQNIYLNAALLGLKEKEIRDREQEIIAFSELENAIDRPVKTYSSGMYVRLAFSIATSVDPQILIIDEALSVGDQRFQQKCVDRMMNFRKANKTLIICTHSMYMINELCSRTLWLKNGRLCDCGRTSSVVSSYLAHLENDVPGAVNTTPAKSQRPDILIEEVRLLDEDRKSMAHIHQFQTLVVQVQTRRVGPPVMGHLAIGFGFEDDTQVFETTTKMSGLAPILFSGEQLIELTIPSIPLLGGNYMIRVRAGDEHALRTIYQMNYGPLIIESEHPEIGITWIPHSWKVP